MGQSLVVYGAARLPLAKGEPHMALDYTWPCWPQAEALIEQRLEEFLAAHAPARALATELYDRASTRIFDWLDHLVVRAGEPFVQAAQAVGYRPEPVDAPVGAVAYAHPGAQLPRLLVVAGAAATPQTTAVAVRAESIADFLLARGLSSPIAGDPLSPYRLATVWSQEGRAVLVVERRGYRGYLPQQVAAGYATRYLAARERWATRPRRPDDDAQGMVATLEIARDLVAEVGRDMAAWIVFEVERDYWQRRNWAGQIQKARQDRLGLGWANHDHHTFRSSRPAFTTLIATLETLGFACRERFYAGQEAGWGAQVLEQPACGLVVFADVDLQPGETDLDFAHIALPPGQRLGTVGLWCALHGESLLGAGMHHLEAQFEFDRLRDDLATVGVGMMKPFSDAPHLRQAFTKGERWPVAPDRLQRPRAAGQITEDQYHTFLTEGAIGSHLENLQRRQGYKGFNQHNVSSIITATDPRHAVTA